LRLIEPFVEEVIIKGMKYQGRIIWDQLYSGIFFEKGHFIRFHHFLVDKKIPVTTDVYLEDDTTIKYFKAKDNTMSDQKQIKNDFEKALHNRIMKINSPEDKMIFYLRLFFDRKISIIRYLKNEHFDSSFLIFRNSNYHEIIKSAIKKYYKDNVLEIFWGYRSFIIYDEDEKKIHDSLYFSTDRPGRFNNEVMVIINVDESISEVKFDFDGSPK
jgi:hypothetical protein